MLETYSEATVNNCYFEGNEATDNGGAILVKIRSQLTLSNSIFKLNKANNTGGPIIIQQSMAIIKYCTFLNESAV